MRLVKRAVTVYRKGGPKTFVAQAISYFRKHVLGRYVFRPFVSMLQSLLAVVVSREPGLVLLGFNDEIQGSSGRLYLRLLESNNEDLTPVWMTNSTERAGRMVATNDSVVGMGSLRGRVLRLRADVACYDGTPSVRFPNRITTIKMNHQVPIKYGPKSGENAPTPTDAPCHDYHISTSEFLSRVQREYYRTRKGGEQIDRTTFVPLGFPRNDIVVNPPDQTRRRWEEFLDGESYEMVLLYAPTRRQYHLYDLENTDLFPFKDFSIERLHTFLEEHNTLLLVRLHPWDAKHIADKERTYETVHPQGSVSAFLTDLCAHDHVMQASSEIFADTNKLLPFVDVLITDYSTVYHTFLLLDRPIIFVPYDYDKVKENLGFKYSFCDDLPGPAINSFEHFLNYVRQLITGEDSYEDRRSNLRKKIYDHPDGDATGRVADFVRAVSSIDSEQKSSRRH